MATHYRVIERCSCGATFDLLSYSVTVAAVAS